MPAGKNLPSYMDTQLPGRQRLIVLTHEFYPTVGGIAIFVREMATAASTLGQLVEVWAPDHPLLRHHPFPFSVRTLPLKGSQDWVCRARLSRQIVRNRSAFEDAILYLPEPGPIRALAYLSLILKLNCKRLIVTLHGSEILNLTSRWHRRITFARLLDRCDRISTVSQFSLDLLTDRFPSLRSKTILTQGALREEFRNFDLSKVASAGSKLIVLTVARIHPRKGQHLLIEALGRLDSSLRAEIEYWIAGPTVRPSYRRFLKRRSEALRVSARFLGEVADQDLPKIYSQSDIFAMTSIDYKKSLEGYGLSYVEASAMGLPVVAHSVGGVPEVVRHGVTGLLIDPQDGKSLTEALRTLLTDTELRRQLGQAGRSRALTATWEDNAKRLLGE